MGRRDDTRLPRGFAGTVCHRREVAPAGSVVVCLPEQGVADGPFLRLPDTPFDAAVVEHLTESMGDLRRFLSALATRLPPGGGILVDLANAQAPASLHWVLDGRPGSFDPIGSLREPERRVLLRPALAAAEAAGLLVEDVYRVPSAPDALGDRFAHNLVKEGFLATACIAGPPPDRLWLVARKAAPLAGSAIIGAGSVTDQDRTARALAAILPDGWETVRCSGPSAESPEAENDELVGCPRSSHSMSPALRAARRVATPQLVHRQAMSSQRLASNTQDSPTLCTNFGDNPLEGFNQAVPRTSGELLWFLPAGSVPSAELCHGLIAAALTGPAVPEAAASTPGNFCGLMISRLALLEVGPLPRRWECADVAYEDFGLRIAAQVRAPVTVEGELSAPRPPAIDAALLQRETAILMERWEPIVADPFRGERVPNRAAADQHSPPWEGREPRISLCMIARDEEQFLAECLESAAPVVDEIVLVDTGSVDRTVEIAESFGARVEHEPWQDDFATARNHSLEAATGDWILVLDADERIAEGAQEISELVRDPGVSGYHLILRNIFEGGETQGVRIVRLFRNLPGIHYQNRLHEQVTPSLASAADPQGLVLSSCDVALEHLGYQDHVMTSRRKDERNERLFKLDLQERPEDIYVLYKYGDFLRRLRNREHDCLELLERGLELVWALPPHERTALPYAAEIAALCALEHAREDRFEPARAIIEQAFGGLMPTPNLHYIAAGLDLRAGHNDDAIAHFRRCLAYADQVLVVPIQEGITGHVAITGLAQSYLQKGDQDRAMRLLLQSRAMCPSFDVTALTLSRLYFERRQFSESVQVLTEHLASYPDSAGVCQQASVILSQLGMTDEARTLGERAIDLLEKASLVNEANKMRETVAAIG